MQSHTAITSIVIRVANQSEKNLSLRDSAFYAESWQSKFSPLPCGGGLRGWVRFCDSREKRRISQ
ncbi:hypothetical protein [Helicobacter sp. 23-1045]